MTNITVAGDLVSPPSTAPIRVTKVKITLPGRNDRDCMLAYVDVEVNYLLIIHNIKLIQVGGHAPFLDFPSTPFPAATRRCVGCHRKITCIDRYCSNCGLENLYRGDVKYSNIVHPINEEGRKIFHEAVLREYRKQKSAIQDLETLTQQEEQSIEAYSPGLLSPESSRSV